MATTQNTFTGNGSNLGPFSFTFKWLEPTDIKVTVAGVLKTAGTHYNLQSLNYSTKTGGQVLFTAGNVPANGAAIVVYRQTDDSDLAATFYSGSAIRAQDLNNNFIQGLYVTQESSNTAAAATTTANAATTTANTALSNSTAAQASAASAVSTANAANSTAASAVSTANTANATAAAAVSTANTANTNASSALSAVSSALLFIPVANVAAIPSSPTNGQAVRVLDSTGIESFTPLSGVPVGFVGNSALNVEIYYQTSANSWVWNSYSATDPENRYLKISNIGTSVQAYDVDTAKTDVVQTFTAAQRGTVSVLTSAATVTPNFATANNFSLTLGHSLTLANPTNLTAGQSGAIVITQGSGTAYTVAYGSYWKFSGGTPTMSTGLSSVSTLVYYVESATRITARLITNVT